MGIEIVICCFGPSEDLRLRLPFELQPIESLDRSRPVSRLFQIGSTGAAGRRSRGEPFVLFRSCFFVVVVVVVHFETQTTQLPSTR